MARILVVYSTTDGHTRKICDRLRSVIEREGHQVALASIRDEPGPDPVSFDKVVVGASIRYGKHSPRVFEFIRRHQKILDSKPGAFFSVNVVARKPRKSRPHTNPYMKQFLKSSAWHPRELAVFAGKIDYRRYNFRDRVLIRLVMWMTDGPTERNAVAEFTDWAQVDAFAAVIARM